MTRGFSARHFSIGLPEAAEDQSLAALFRHVGEHLAEEEPIRMEDLIAISFDTDPDPDAVWRGTFTIVFSDK